MGKQTRGRRSTTLGRIFKTGFVNFFRNISLSVAATAVMVVTLTIVLFFVIANATFNHSIEEINNKIVVSVYLKDNVSPDKKDALINKLQGLDNVKSVKYVSKSDALIQYRADNKDNLELLQAVSQTDNPLPATIQVKPKDPTRNEEIKAILETTDIKALQSDETSYSGDRKEAIDKISNATSFFKKAVLVSVIVFTVISMLIIFNTIQMAIFNRRDELRIMRLLGASTWFIRGPFIVETMFYGIVSAILSIIICNSLFLIQDQAFNSSSLGLLDLTYANQYFIDHFYIFLGMQFLLGIFIGAVSALIATKRFVFFSEQKSRPLRWSLPH